MGDMINIIAGGAGLVFLILIIVVIIGACKVISKAGQPGWAAIVPIYSFVVLLKIIDKPVWWLLLMIFVPFFIIIPFIELAKKFGKGVGFGLGLAFFGFIFFPMLGFGDAQYQG